MRVNTVTVPGAHGVTRPGAVLQIDVHLDEEQDATAELMKTDTDRYHGGTPSDEVAALFSLCLG
jgi:hypothetical protein